MSSQWVDAIGLCMFITFTCSVVLLITASLAECGSEPKTKDEEASGKHNGVTNAHLATIVVAAVVIFFCNVVGAALINGAKDVEAHSTTATTQLLYELLEKVEESDQDKILQHIIDLNEVSYRTDKSIGEDYMRFAHKFPTGHHFREDLLLHAGTYGLMKHPPAETTNAESDSASP